MKHVILMSILLLFAAPERSWAQVLTGPIPDDEKSVMISELRSLRMVADREAADCFRAGEDAAGRALNKLSTTAISVNSAMRAVNYTYESLNKRILNDLQPINNELAMYPDVLDCEPSKARDMLSSWFAQVAYYRRG